MFQYWVPTWLARLPNCRVTTSRSDPIGGSSVRSRGRMPLQPSALLMRRNMCRPNTLGRVFHSDAVRESAKGRSASIRYLSASKRSVNHALPTDNGGEAFATAMHGRETWRHNRSPTETCLLILTARRESVRCPGPQISICTCSSVLRNRPELVLTGADPRHIHAQVPIMEH